MSYHHELENAKKFVESLKEYLPSCGIALLKMNDEDLKDSLFEDGSLNNTFFYLTEVVLEYAKDRWVITDEVFEKAVHLGKWIRGLEDTKKWSVESVRNDKEWRDIMSLADEIMAEL